MAFLFTFLILLLVIGFAWRITREQKTNATGAKPYIHTPDGNDLEKDMLASFHAERKYNEGINYFEKMELGERTPAICQVAVQLYVANRQYRKASELLAWRKNQGEYSVYDTLNEVTVLAGLKKRDEALILLNDLQEQTLSVKVDKGDWDTTLYMMKEYMLLCKLEEFLIAKGTPDEYNDMYLAYALMKMKRYDESLNNYKIALAKGYNGKEASGNMVYMLFKLGRYAAAREVIETIEPDNLDGMLYSQWAYTYSQENNHLKAEEIYAEGLRKFVANADLWNGMGYHLIYQGRYEEAIGALDKAIELSPNYAFAYNNRGLAMVRLGRMEEGLSDIEYSEKLDPKNAYVYAHRGIYHLVKGEKKKALELFLKGKSMDPGIKDIDALIAQAG